MKKKMLISVGLLAVVLLILSTQIGFYTVQPIGALPDGITLVVWRESGDPFFDSPDAYSMRMTGSVSLLSRGFALVEAPTDSIILRLPYWEFAYLQSTGGVKYEN